MNLKDYIAKAKRILSEHSGSEGIVYILKTKNTIPQIENDIVKINEVETKNGFNYAKVEFSIPRDCGFALVTLDTILDIEIESLELIY